MCQRWLIFCSPVKLPPCCSPLFWFCYVELESCNDYSSKKYHFYLRCLRLPSHGDVYLNFFLYYFPDFSHIEIDQYFPPYIDAYLFMPSQLLSQGTLSYFCSSIHNIWYIFFLPPSSSSFQAISQIYLTRYLYLGYFQDCLLVQYLSRASYK